VLSFLRRNPKIFFDGARAKALPVLLGVALALPALSQDLVSSPPASPDDTSPRAKTKADVTVTAPPTFRDLSDPDTPADDLVGIASSASAGIVTARQIAERETHRSADVLEAVPGLVVSQHSGEGKANQYYLRGFNLDHGTDVASTVAGVPVNMPTHAHGQGYSDNNFLIPELVSGIQYKKGPYYADEGDFSAAGAVNVNYVTNRSERSPSVAGNIAAVSLRARSASARAPSSARSSCTTTTVHGRMPTTTGSSTRSSGGPRAGRRAASASRASPTRGAGTRPTKSRSAESTKGSMGGTTRSTRRTAGNRTATVSRPTGRGRAKTRRPGSRRTSSTTPSTSGTTSRTS
jgi:hypothetical protein